MSSRNQDSQKLENICKIFFKWETLKEKVMVEGEEFQKVKGGTFSYWDAEEPNSERETGKGKTKYIDLPLEFAILNPDLISFKGYDKPKAIGTWSNEVIYDKKNSLYNPNAKVEVKDFKGNELVTFTLNEYSNKDTKEDIKRRLKDAPAKYTQSVYMAFRDENGEWKLGNLQLNGGSLTGAQEEGNEDDRNDGWFSYCRIQKPSGGLFKYTIKVEDYKVKKKADGGKFTIPVYSQGDLISKEDSAILSKMDNELTTYLKIYLNKPKLEETPVDQIQEQD